MSTAEAIGVGLAIIVVGMVVIAIRGLPAFAWFRSLIDKKREGVRGIAE